MNFILTQNVLEYTKGTLQHKYIRNGYYDIKLKTTMTK